MLPTIRAALRIPRRANGTRPEHDPSHEAASRSCHAADQHAALMAAGLVDRVQVTLFPFITGRTGLDPIFHDAADFDLEFLESRTLDGHIQEIIYRAALN